MKEDNDYYYSQTIRRNENDIIFNTRNMVPKWTRLCWWLSRKLGGIKVFGKQDLT